MRIVILHYHFFPGGVTSAVRESLRALKSSGSLEDKEIVLLCGHERGTGNLLDALKTAGIQVKINIHPELFYRQDPWSGKKEFENDARKLADILLSYGRSETIFWIHNPTLGKNPALTRALIMASEESEKNSDPYNFLYHIHDFPECGRPNNLRFLFNCYPGGGLKSLYPETSNVSFVCINSADRELMFRCGVPRKKVFFLPNAINVSDRRNVSCAKETVASSLKKYAEKHGYFFDPLRPWWLMPVRLIRRKNALEAFFLRIFDKNVQILITLDANSAPEYPYANAVKAAIKRENAPGIVGFGAELVGKTFSFEALICSSRAVVTTSLMEGFGFAFIEGPIRGKPVLGRNLPHVTKDFGTLGLPPDNLYDSFFVPVPAKTRGALNTKFREFAREYGKIAGIGNDIVDKYIAEVDRIYENEAVDFGFLDLPSQLDLFSKLKDPGFCQQIMSLNRISLTYSEVSGEFARNVKRSFGYRAYGDRLNNIFESLPEGLSEKIPAGLGQKLKEAFFSPERNRPLFW